MPRMNSSGSIFAVRVEIELPLAASLSTEAPYGLRPAVALSFSAYLEAMISKSSSRRKPSPLASIIPKRAQAAPPLGRAWHSDRREAAHRPCGARSSRVVSGEAVRLSLAPHVEVGFCLPESRHNRLLVDARQRSERGSRVAPTLVVRATRCTWSFVHGTYVSTRPQYMQHERTTFFSHHGHSPCPGTGCFDVRGAHVHSIRHRRHRRRRPRRPRRPP